MKDHSSPWIDVGVHRLPMQSPDDVSELENLLQSQAIQADTIVGIIAQTEGTGYARGYTSLCLQLLLSQFLNCSREAVFARIPLMMIGLCGGLMSPHYTVFTRSSVAAPVTPPQEKRLTVGVANTRDLFPEEYGTPLQVQLVGDAVRAAITDAGITDLEDVHCVEIKCPAMTPNRLQDATARGVTVISTNLGQASSFSKAASALGIGVAVGEIAPDSIRAEAINHNPDLYTNRGSVSAGGEQSACRVLVMGNATHSLSPYRIGHGVMQDQLDLQGVINALNSAGLSCALPLTAGQQQQITQLLINCGADAQSSVRGRRHTIHSDFLSGYAGIMAKTVANAVVAAVVGDPMILASAGNEHQGAPGSNLVAAIIQRSKVT
ncbi:MAG: ring-opening amidohydrolase [Synechococcaceae cyanobacterium SM2_3_1]|nr:ring-opening amidohydrolase [Synechococcaceae cyanobacterium SM2_3_1]